MLGRVVLYNGPRRLSGFGFTSRVLALASVGPDEMSVSPSRGRVGSWPRALDEADLKKARVLLRSGDYTKVQVAQKLQSTATRCGALLYNKRAMIAPDSLGTLAEYASR